MDRMELMTVMMRITRKPVLPKALSLRLDPGRAGFWPPNRQQSSFE